jgi:hypothetical protein
VLRRPPASGTLFLDLAVTLNTPASSSYLEDFVLDGVGEGEGIGHLDDDVAGGGGGREGGRGGEGRGGGRR